MSLMNLVTGVIAEKSLGTALKFLLDRQFFVIAPRLLSTKDVTTSEDTEDEMEEGVTQNGAHTN